MERIYRVSFFKRLADRTGHAVDACQGAVEVRAPSEEPRDRNCPGTDSPSSRT